ncbi:MAG: FAD-dependent oxidoreductase [Candidatus Nanohaloarchaea archaeon]
MADAIVVGDGPTGLQAALLLGKNGIGTRVYGQDETYLHDAMLYNYLGIEEMHGSEFAEIARRQAEQYGADLIDGEVVAAAETADGMRIETGDGTTDTADYLVLAEGDAREVAADIGVEFDGDTVDTDRNGRTSIENVYAGGWTARDLKVQAAISVGDGAAIALDILSREKGEPFHDFDVPGDD